MRSALLRRHPELSLWSQEDAHEAVEKILDALQDEWTVVAPRRAREPGSGETNGETTNGERREPRGQKAGLNEMNALAMESKSSKAIDDSINDSIDDSINDSINKSINNSIDNSIDGSPTDFNASSNSRPSSPRGDRVFPTSERGAWASLCHEALSPITAVFSCLLRSVSTCGSCGASVSTTQQATSLSLPIPAGHRLQVTVILYHPIYIDDSLLIAPKPRQLALLVHQNCSLHQLQALLSQADLMHGPEECYALHAASGQWKPWKLLTRRVATADWVNGRMTEGRNLVCRVLPNAKISAGMEHVRWIGLEVLQEGRLKKLPRSVLLGMGGLTAGRLWAQLELLCRNGEAGER